MSKTPPKKFGSLTIPTPANNQRTALPDNRLAEASSTKKLIGAMVVPLAMLFENPNQVRRDFSSPEAVEALQELADDIKVRGILEPIIVRTALNTDSEATYEIVAGARRYRAAKEAGLAEVPVILRDMDDQEAKLTMLVENLQRQDISETDERTFFELLQADYNLSGRDIAKLINKSPMYVSRRLRETMEVKVETVTDSEKSNNNNKMLHSDHERDSLPPPKYARLTPAVFNKFNAALDNATEWVQQVKPETRQQIRENIEDIERKLTELKRQLDKEAK